MLPLDRPRHHASPAIMPATKGSRLSLVASDSRLNGAEIFGYSIRSIGVVLQHPVPFRDSERL